MGAANSPNLHTSSSTRVSRRDGARWSRASSISLLSSFPEKSKFTVKKKMIIYVFPSLIHDVELERNARPIRNGQIRCLEECPPQKIKKGPSGSGHRKLSLCYLNCRLEENGSSEKDYEWVPLFFSQIVADRFRGKNRSLSVMVFISWRTRELYKIVDLRVGSTFVRGRFFRGYFTCRRIGGLNSGVDFSEGREKFVKFVISPKHFNFGLKGKF